MAQIKKDTSLRKAILQAAITGQLISSCHSELDSESAETGKELLDKIIEERNNKLLAEWEEKQTDLFASNDTHSKNAKTVRSEQIRLSKKIKKPEPIVASEIDEDEIPFEIPENWCWCKVKDIAEVFGRIGFRGYTTNDLVMKGNGAITISPSNLLENGITDFSKCTYISWEKYEESPEIKIFEQDILMVKTGSSYGKSSIVTNLPEKATINPQLAVLKNILINRYYLNTVFQTQFARNQYEDFVLGTSIPTFSQEKLNNFILPLPPLAVQNAIVEKLEQVLPLVDAYENAILQKEELKSALPDKVKKAILQEAITGQLTEAWRKSATIKESGKQLLDRIIEERNAKALADWEEALKKNPKAKKPADIVASEIEEEEIPFEVPESWCWCRLGDLGNFVRGSGIKRDETRSEGFPCIRYGEMYTRYKTVINETVSFVDKNVFDKCQKIIKNDIAMALTGENEYDIALAAVYTGDKEIAMGGDMTRFRPAFVNSLFLVFALNSPYGIECKSELATGNIIVHISNDKLGSIMIPLPPLEEQAEIVKKVEELLPLCK
ncbi:MAG: restriction endonuclease subunit S [Treponema porcinum]|uniref:restriction endonuclease subunit S n=1 Tax=Treponema porcinum TaxID=261392 RepID=UPI002354E47C|nr:restriction endonuclease subunit S [Treponema porcinum]MCI6816181.1 restriction endonuclease subunit S [Treponema porcinum]